MKKSFFSSKITTPILHKFQPLHGVTTWLPNFAVPQKGWSNTSFIMPESCIALVYCVHPTFLDTSLHCVHSCKVVSKFTIISETLLTINTNHPSLGPTYT